MRSGRVLALAVIAAVGAYASHELGHAVFGASAIVEAGTVLSVATAAGILIQANLEDKATAGSGTTIILALIAAGSMGAVHFAAHIWTVNEPAAIATVSTVCAAFAFVGTSLASWVLYDPR